MQAAEDEFKDFHFRLTGPDVDIDAGSYRAKDEKGAFREAFKNTKRLTLPGWSLVCVETGTIQGAAEFFDTEGRKVRA